MGYPQSNQQTPFIGYPQNQLYNPQDLQYMQDTQKDFLNWGQWQPGMMKTSQWITDPVWNDPTNDASQSFLNTEQNKLNEYYQRVGTPYEQSQRQSYWQQMGGQHYGGIIAPEDPYSPFPGTPGYNKLRQPPDSPWGALNNMGVSSAYGMPAWQQMYFAEQTPGPGQPNNAEQFSLTSGQTPQSFQNALMTQNPNFPGVPQQSSGGPPSPAAPEWMYPQQQSAWGNDSSNPWSSNTGWGGKGWGQ
jgi:hypothetical protein